MSKTTENYYQFSEGAPVPIRWTAPEVLKSRKFTKEGDVWSFAVTMYEVLAREVPYYELSNEQVVQFVCKEDGRLSKPRVFEYPEEIYQVMAKV